MQRNHWQFDYPAKRLHEGACARLHEMGARIRVYDPVAIEACKREHPDLPVHYCSSVESLANGADALVLVTEWEEFQRLDLDDLSRRMARAILVDGRNVFDADTVRRAGFEYCGIGKGSQRPKGRDEGALRAIA